MDNIGNNIEKKDFTSEEVFSAIIYTVFLDRDGNELYNIHKNSINGRRGVFSKTEFDNMSLLKYLNLQAIKETTEEKKWNMQQTLK